jgi:hypothetical protein
MKDPHGLAMQPQGILKLSDAEQRGLKRKTLTMVPIY